MEAYCFAWICIDLYQSDVDLYSLIFFFMEVSWFILDCIGLCRLLDFDLYERTWFHEGSYRSILACTDLCRFMRITMNICLYIYISYIYVCVYTSLSLYIYMCVCACVSVLLFRLDLYGRTYADAYVFIWICVALDGSVLIYVCWYWVLFFCRYLALFTLIHLDL